MTGSGDGWSESLVQGEDRLDNAASGRLVNRPWLIASR
jgi:hypothetical protein